VSPQDPPARFRIRPAGPEDAGLVLRFIRELAEYERLGHEVVATEERLRQHLAPPAPACEALLAFAGDEPVGFALFFPTYSTFLAQPGLHLEDLYVPELHRGRGYGGRLLAELARIARERGCGRLEWAVLDWNEPAIRFYRSIGAALLKEWQTFRLSGEALAAVADRAEVTGSPGAGERAG